MYRLKEKFALQSIRNKIIITFLFGCLVAFFSGFIARVVFRETFSTIEIIARPNPKLIIVNELFHKIHRLDQVQKLQVLKFPDAPGGGAGSESVRINQLLDSLRMYCRNDTFQLSRITRMQRILSEREALFSNYIKFRNSTSFSKDMRHLSDYISKNIKRSDSGIVRSTKKNTITTQLAAEPEVKAPEKKESFFRRLFGKKKNEKDEKSTPPRKTVTEDVQITIDTFAVTQRDSFIKDVEKAITAIEKNQDKAGTGLVNHEMKLSSASTIFMDELQQLLQQVQQEEIRDMQDGTASLNDVFNTAFTRVGIILVIFFVLTIVLIFLMFSDISQSRKTGQQLMEAKEKAEQLEQVKHRFLANMSHEIRTPLQAIIGYAEQMKGQESPGNTAVDAIYRSSSHLLQIVNEVLDYSRIVSGKFQFEKQEFDMSELLAEVSDIMTGQADARNIHFTFKSTAESGRLYSGDPFRLKQVLYNLLGNAIKFTHQGEVAFSIISTPMEAQTTEFTFEVRDSGIGMTEQELKHIFGSFEQAGHDTQRQYGGTGLGLSIAKTLVDMQGGTIGVHSEKNKGSVFTVKISYLNAGYRQEEPTACQLPAPISYTGKVMVIDDDAFILQLCDAILTKHSIAHSCYSSPEKAFGDTWDKATTLVLMDIRMPMISGHELYRLLRQKAAANVKFVALTAQALPDEKADILTTGFDQVLLKPFREKDLLQLLTGAAGEVNAPYQTVDHFDLSSIVTMCVNDKALLRKTLKLYTEQAQADLHVLEAAVAIENRQKIAEICHRLSATMGQTGLHALAQALHATEINSSKANGWVLSTGEFESLKKRIGEAIQQVKNYEINLTT